MDKDLGICHPKEGTCYHPGAIILVETKIGSCPEEFRLAEAVHIGESQRIAQLRLIRDSATQFAEEHIYVIMCAGPGKPLILRLAGTVRLPGLHISRYAGN